MLYLKGYPEPISATVEVKRDHYLTVTTCLWKAACLQSCIFAVLNITVVINLSDILCTVACAKNRVIEMEMNFYQLFRKYLRNIDILASSDERTA